MDFSFIEMQGSQLLIAVIFLALFLLWRKQEIVIKNQNELRQQLPLDYALKKDIKTELENLNSNIRGLHQLILKELGKKNDQV